MTDDQDATPADTMAERTDKNRIALRLLLETNRLGFAGGVTVLAFVAVATGLTLLEPPFLQRAATSDPIETLFGAMITTIVTVTTLVVTIGQLVLTQENGPLGDQRERLDSSMAVRDDIQAVTGSPNPADPAAFLAALLTTATEQANRLDASVSDRTARVDGGGPRKPANPSAEETFHAALAALADDVVEDAVDIADQLEGADFGTFEVVGAALNFTYDTKLVEIERIEHEYRERLTASQRETLSELTATLSLFAAAREHVKTLYFQWTLIDLSRLILYAAIPAIVVGAIAIGVLTPETAPGRTLGVDHLVLLVSAAFAVTFAPFAIFTAYVLRVLTVTKRTLAIDPLVLRDSK
jgi:hypothetical protein